MHVFCTYSIFFHRSFSYKYIPINRQSLPSCTAETLGTVEDATGRVVSGSCIWESSAASLVFGDRSVKYTYF